MENNEDNSTGEQGRKVVTMSSNLGEVCELLLQLMSSESHLDINSVGNQSRANRLMEETDLFSRLAENGRFEITG